jgi:ATP-binding cassette, subfamily B, bacterial
MELSRNLALSTHGGPMPNSAANGARKEPRFRQLHTAVRFALPQRHAIFIIIGLTLVVGATSALEPLVLKWIFDGLTTVASLRLLLIGIGTLLGLAMLREAMDGFANWLTWRTRIGFQYALLEATIGKLHRMPLAAQRSEGIGAIMTRLDRSIQGLTSAVSLLLFGTLPALMFLIIAATIMIRLEWRLAILVIAFAPLPGLIAARAAPEQTTRERTLLDRWAQIYSRFNEVLSGIVIVRSFAMEDAEKSRFLRDVNEANKVVVRGVATDAGYASAANVVIALARIAGVGLGGYLVLDGQITIGTVVAFLGYIGGLFGPVQGLSSIYSTLRKASVSLEEICKILNVQEHLGDSPDARDVESVKGDVCFEHVCFRYEQSGRPLLDDVTLHVKPGESVAIVGPSGSGKTTLMALLMRFYDPMQGRILLDGQDLRTVKQSAIRRNISVVLQDPLLFNDTIRANIAYGRPEASMAEIQDAAKAAFAHDFIMRLPEGYETIVGERGGRLSGGERQRITIARALLKNPPILILDEPTSALDTESEEAVQNAIEHLMHGRTIFVIAHRLTTVINAERILVLKEGRVVESGTHWALVKHGGYYASLIKRQSRGLIPNDTDISATPRASSFDVSAPLPS